MADEKKPSLAMAILADAKPKAKPAESEPEGDEDVGALSAMEEFLAAVKSGDARTALEAFRNVKELC